MTRAPFLSAIAILGSAALHPAAAQVRHWPPLTPARTDLADHWQIQSSAQVPQTGDQISTPGFHPQGWYPATVPSTVVAAQVADNVYPDPYYSLDLRSIPGTTYDFGDNFAVDPMPVDSPYVVPWWYRTVFHLGRIDGLRIWLNFDSINCRANIWLNGRQIATTSQVQGMYRSFEFDVTDLVAEGTNVLAVQVFAPTLNDFFLTFVDWNPLPPDKDMGLVRPVYIRTSGPVALRNSQVVTQVDPALDRAHLTLYADLSNPGADAVSGTLQGTIGSIAVSQAVQLAPGESKRVAFTPQNYPVLDIQDPQLWWPAGLGRRTCTSCTWSSPPRDPSPTPKTSSSAFASSPPRSTPNSIASSASMASESSSAAPAGPPTCCSTRTTRARTSTSATCATCTSTPSASKAAWK